MLGIVHRLNTLSLYASQSCLENLRHQVRWRRKPRWLPTAKSKIFKVPERQKLPVEEEEEIRRLMNNYRTQIKSIRRYLTYRYCTEFQASADPEQQKKIFEEDLARCMEINDKWNAEQKISREARVAEEMEAEIEFAKKRLQSEKLKREQQAREADEIVRRLQGESKTFITAENIDAAIEHAIANPSDYNFAIDLDGNKILGRETKPSDDGKGAQNAEQKVAAQN